MKKYSKYIIIIMVTMILFLGLTKSKEDNKGVIKIWTNEFLYNYLMEQREYFEKENKDIYIEIEKVNEENIIKNLSKVEKDELPQIIIVDNDTNKEISDLYGNNIINEDIIHNHKKSFIDSRLDECIYNDEIMGIPITANPIAMFVRNDILEEYGYKIEDLNTWDDLLKIGIEIFNKTKGDVRLFNYKDIDYIRSVMLTQKKAVNDDKANIETDQFIDFIKEKELVGEYGSKYIVRITSFQFIKELYKSEKDLWEVGKPPAITPGGNRFIVDGGTNMVVFNTDNYSLIDTFIEFILENNKVNVKSTINGELFFAFNTVYSLSKIDNEFPGVIGESPLSVFVNIALKAKK